MALAKTLKERRSALGLTLLDIANRMGVSEATVQRWESGNIKSLRYERISRLADILRVSPSLLMGWDEENLSAPVVTDEFVVMPVIGDLAAGYNSIAMENWTGETVNIPKSYIKGRKAEEFVVLSVKGDSMFPAYQNGDKVLILRQECVPFSGAVAAVIYEDELSTLKKVVHTDSGVRLEAINPAVPPISIFGEKMEHFNVIGVPRLLIREITD